MEEASGPSKDTGNTVGAGFSAFLVFSVVSGDSAVRGFGLYDVSWCLQNTGHESQTAVALGQSV